MQWKVALGNPRWPASRSHRSSGERRMGPNICAISQIVPVLSSMRSVTPPFQSGMASLSSLT